MTETLSPAGLIANAAIEALVARVNDALGAPAKEPVLSYNDSDGISLTVAAKDAPKLAVENLKTGGGGVSGRLYIEIPEGKPLSAELFGGFSVGLTAFDLTLAKGAFVSTHVAGELTIPFFTDEDEEPETVDFEVAVRADGSLAVTLAAQQSDASKMTPDGLVKLHYELPAETSIDLSIATLELEQSNKVWQVTLSGSLALETVGIDWPEVELRGLSIDAHGNVTLQGGWLELPSHTAIDFFGFHVALQRVGFGSEGEANGKKQRWIGFDGEVNLVEGVPLGGSVRGLKVSLETGAVSFSGVSVAFEIPGVLSLSGEIDHAHLKQGEDPTALGLPSNFPTPADVFAGGVDVDIEAAGGLEVDAQFIVAQVAIEGVTQSCFFLALDAELPAGIPLFADVALYGLSGMFASNLRPELGAEATWWDWYKYQSKNGTPEIGGQTDYTATDVNKWLHPEAGAFALGAGAVIGTQDDGFTASASIAFIVILPGPVVMFIGKANILSKRISGPSDEANFEAMATYDGIAETFELVIEAQYSIPVVLDVQATAELYVDPKADVWFLAIGKPPHEQRVKARVLDLFESDLYFVVSDTGLVAGIWSGYSNSWSFGPLSAKIEAYYAAMAAIQWSPLQLGAGVELHGEVLLEAFGIKVGITADALLEATAPDPWWVHGELSVELDLPWPLPNVGGTVSLSWGESGPPPPAPLALNAVSATLVDHGASDRYELLAHRTGAEVNERDKGDTVVYDSGAPGILAPEPSEYWKDKGYADVGQEAPQVVPDLDPSTLEWAPLVPQDSHFALNFAHPVADLTGCFAEAQSPPSEKVEPTLPQGLGADDMSKIKLQPPAVQWCINHFLLEVALYFYEESQTGQGGSWELVASTQPSGGGGTPSPGLTGVWLAPETKNVPPLGTVLKVAPYAVLSGEPSFVSWGGPAATLGASFSEGELQFSAGPGVQATVASPGTGLPSGLCFKAVGGAQGTVSIGFPWKAVLSSLNGMVLPEDGKPPSPLQLYSGGEALTPTSTSQEAASSIYTLAFDPSAAPVSELELTVGEAPVYLISIGYTPGNIEMPILPQAPGLYALKTVTRIEAGQVDAKGEVNSYQPVAEGDAVIEFAYMQCASGPGTATIDAPASGDGPHPNRQPPHPPLAEAANSPANVFPNGGRLEDLATYTQWSWPGEGAAAAYYGYDLNVEFNETYVNALYATFLSNVVSDELTSPPTRPALHMRCVDRNRRHTLLRPLATHVPSAYPQSAIVSAAVELPMPASIAPPVVSTHATPVTGGEQSVSASSLAAAQATMIATRPLSRLVSQVDHTALPALGAAIASAGLDVLPAALGAAIAANPGLHPTIAHELEEQAAAAKARALWFVPLAPQTLYTLDVVAGPLNVGNERKGSSVPIVPTRSAGTTGQVDAPGLDQVLGAPDAIGTLAALEAYLAADDALTVLQRVQFATSRYATFNDQLANVVAQTAGTATTPVQRYAVAPGSDPQTWLSSSAAETTRTESHKTYLTARTALAGVIARFEPLFDARQAAVPADPASGNGERALSAQRAVTEKAWEAFSSATASTFDGLIAALGQPTLVSSAHVPPPPDTELSVLTTDADTRVVALLLSSPEPLPWRRMWQWTTLDPAGPRASGLKGIAILWSADQTRALIVPLGSPAGPYALTLGFQGNIGAELACITSLGTSVSEAATSSAITIAPAPRRGLPVRAG
jgi:hypothetical protein